MTAIFAPDAERDRARPGACPAHNSGARHHLLGYLTAISAPAAWVSPPTGDLCCGADGLYVAERRLLALWQLSLDGAVLLPLDAAPDGPQGTRHTSYLPLAGGASRDPQLIVTRIRHVDGTNGVERISVDNRSGTSMSVTLRLRAACDLATPGDVRAGAAAARLPWRICEPGGPQVASVTAPDGAQAEIVATDEVRVAAPRPEILELSWDLDLPPGDRWHADVAVTGRAAPLHPRIPDFRPTPPDPCIGWLVEPAITSADARVELLVRQSVADLSRLRMADPLDHADVYLGAGAPWYLTLFGRDSLWSARLAMALGTGLAAGTLRALARRQGTRVDPATGEAPGRIPHEARPAHIAKYWPPLYYGSIDATPLWMITLMEAWRWGMPTQQVAALLEPLERALAWIVEYGDPGSGFLSYAGDPKGLANQGWKDSAAAIRHSDGRFPAGPIALCELQGYAHEAMTGGAALLEAFGRDGTPWRAWAEELAGRFRDRFWISDENGRYPAIALDGDGQPVTGAASNMGHLPGSGLLTAAEERAVADRLGCDDLADGPGLRAVSSATAGFNPLSYHGGSIWSHDTAIAVFSLSRTGDPEQAALAARLSAGLLTAADRFGGRLPELYGGHRAEAGHRIIGYPAACPVQAWAAAAGPALITAALGLRVDALAGSVRAEPPAVPLLGAFAVDGLRAAGKSVAAGVAADGTLVRFDITENATDQ